MLAWFLSILALFPSLGWAIPHPLVNPPTSAAVYLKPYSAVPTGHYSVNFLKANMVSQEKIRWVHVRDPQTKLSGWTPKQNLLSPLHFSTKARWLAQSPAYRQKTTTHPETALSPAQEVTVDVLDIQHEWVLISHEKKSLWTPISYLYALDKDAGYFYARSEQYLKQQPVVKSAMVTKVPAGQRLRPLQVLGDWAKVSMPSPKGQLVGFIPLAEVISRVDIAMKVKTDKGFELPARDMLRGQIYSIFVNPLWLGSAVNSVPLFQEPSATSPLMGYVRPWKNLLQQDSIEQEWAVSNIVKVGPVWWQRIEEQKDFVKLSKLSTEAFRKVQQNPVFQHLKVAAAKGLYRSTDGVYWAPIRGFSGYNPAFTFSKDGVLFVEDKVSFDNGEHFTPYVHWENLFQTLRSYNIGVKSAVKIRQIETIGGTSQQVVLSLDLGASRPLRLYTADRGQTWTLLKF